MGMMIGRNNSNVTKITLKKWDGSYAGSISITKPKQKKKKRLQYNFKQISTQIMQTKTSGSASQVVSRAHRKVAMLQRQNTWNSDYDATELRHAIIHAQKMERIAKKRMKHLKQEEALAKDQNAYPADVEEKIQDAAIGEMDDKEVLEMSEEELKQLMEELQQAMREAESEWTDSQVKIELTEVALENMDAEDLEALKKKHRAEELREIMEADMKYLKAMFEKLAREKQSASSGSSGSSNNSGSSQSAGTGASSVNNGSAPASLEIGGAEMPVPAPDAAAVVEGGNFDTVV